MGYSKDHPTALYDKEGFIFLDTEGEWFTNQTGGVSCNHPVAQGRFVYQPIPRQIQRETVDKGYFDSGDRAKLDYLFNQAGIPFRVDGGEEAWATGTYTLEQDGEKKEVPAIAIWENSD
jgi:hypothetical protein